MVLDLRDEAALDPARSGAKAAWLARALRAELPVAEGFVVPAEASLGPIRRAARVLIERGSGAARLELGGGGLDPGLADAIRRAAGRLGTRFVVRSSSVLEGLGEWSGAFTSYLGLSIDELERGTLGCWASAFTVATLERFDAAGTRPEDAPMAVLVQSYLSPDFGGTATIEEGQVGIVACEGSPAPLVQGWVSGALARVSADGHIDGDAGLDLLGADRLRAVAETVRCAAALGATACEWAILDDAVWLLQLGRRSPATPSPERPAGTTDPRAAGVARLARRYPGGLGEGLVMSWAVADPSSHLEDAPPLPVDAQVAWTRARAIADRLVSHVWRLTPESGAEQADAALREIRGTRPEAALDRIAGLPTPERALGEELRGLLATVAAELARIGRVSSAAELWFLTPAEVGHALTGGAADAPRARIGFDRWEPFQAAVLIGQGVPVPGTPAAPGLGTGRLCLIEGPEDAGRFRPRDVVVARDPLPHLAPLLWDAAAVVSTGGSPAAHLFESARALGIPALCRVDLEPVTGATLEAASGCMAAAVDGWAGTMYVDTW